MTQDNTDVDLEREKTESYELGHISQLENVAEELRERAGELWATDSHNDYEKAKVLKKWAKEYEGRAEKRRDQWKEKYNGENDG